MNPVCMVSVVLAFVAMICASMSIYYARKSTRSAMKALEYSFLYKEGE